MTQQAHSWAVDDNGCWIWSGKLIAGRPAQYSQGLYVSAARVLWIRSHGDILGKHHVLNACGMRACVSPHHHIIKGYRSVVRSTGRTQAEIEAICAVIKAMHKGRASWNVADLKSLHFDHEFAEELAIRLGSPPILIHAAYSRLLQLGRKNSERVDHSERDASRASVEAAAALLADQETAAGGVPSPKSGGRHTPPTWLPPLD